LIKTLQGQQTPVDRTLAQLDTKGRVALTPPFLVLTIFALAQADSILTVPRRLAQITGAIAAYASWNRLVRSTAFLFHGLTSTARR
jgi:hypothetical protein